MIRDLQEVRDGFRRHRRLSVLHSGLSETSGPLSVWMHRWSQFDLRCRGGLGRIGLCRPNLCVFSTCSKTTRSLQPDGSLIIIILTIPSSESTSRSEGWSEFLRLLSKYLRKPLLRCFMGGKKKRGSGKQREPITTRSRNARRCCDRLIVNFHVRSVGVTTAVSSGCHALSNDSSHKVFRF